jgi:hypothetical protein
LQAWQASGLGARAFAAREGLNVGSLWAWKRKQGSQPSATPVPRMVPVVVTERVERRKALPAEMLELVFTSGYAIRVPSNFDDAALMRLMAIVER